VDGGFDGLLVFADDASPTDHYSASRLIELVQWAGRGPRFVELAPWYSLEYLERDLGISRLKSSREGSPELTRFFGNTSASYFVTAEVAENFLSLISNKPRLRTVSIDWLLTHLGRQLERDNGVEYGVEKLFSNGSLDSGESDLVSP
jgi:hypothetical protein